MYGGGSDTSFSAIHWFIRAMMEHPVYQKRAQAEIDEVVGRARLPRFSDRDSLPYVEAIIKEVLRWVGSHFSFYP